MKIVPIEQLENENFGIWDLYTQKHTPINQTIFHEKGRLLNGFLYFAEGSGIFTHNGKSVTVNEGGLIYLPSGAKHRYTAASSKILHIRIDFRIIDTIRGDMILFDEAPSVILESTPPRIREILDKLVENYEFPKDGSRLRGIALLTSLLSAIADERRNLIANPTEKKILTGIKYIESNFDRELDLAHAAQLCSLSESRFRALFRQVKGMSALEYRDRIRIEKACALLLSGFLRIGEIADILGYGSVYYFSRSFKRATGVSPLQYKNSQIVQK